MAKKASGGKQTSDKVSSTASKGLRTGKLNKPETKSVSGSALGQDEKGKGKGKGKK